ncbi:hypothetical protein CN307_12955 [Bacillus cereus]|uniref:DUF4046 domain-containing protein n=1 Tax=Bacillus cereus TaxID=1396 RepID=A0A2A9A0E6_BACCE|nr:hypothetical protein CN307_12955 [Bacillus cereus]
MRIEEIYQEILDGKRRNFPQYTWSEDVNRELAKRITRYLLEVVLSWDTEQIINGWTRELIVKYKLSGMLGIVYKGNLNQPLHDAYPDRFKEWQLRVAPIGYWTAENSLEALKWTIEVKEQLSDQELMRVYDKGWLRHHKLGTPLKVYWNESPFHMLNALYPGKFKAWQMRKTPRGFWTKETALDLLKWTIEVKEQLTDEQLKQVYEISWLRKHNLSTPLKVFWNTQPFTMLNDLYPGRFKPWELNKTPNGYWTRENALEALKWTIEVKLKLSDEELKKVYSYEWIKQMGLRTPLVNFWNKNGFKMLNTLYPSRYTRDMFIALQPMT